MEIPTQFIRVKVKAKHIKVREGKAICDLSDINFKNIKNKIIKVLKTQGFEVEKCDILQIYEIR